MSTQSPGPVKPAPIRAIVFLLLALCLVASPSGPGASSADFYREAIAELGFIGLLLYWLYDNRHAGRITLTISATRVWFAGLFALATASAFWAVSPAFFVSKYLLWVAAAAVFLVTLTLSAEERTRIVLARSVVFAAACVSIIGLSQAFFSLDIFSQTVPPAATFVNKNATAQVLVLIFPVGFFLLFAERNKHLARLYPFILALIVAYIFHSQTRAAWLSIFGQGVLLVPGLIWCAMASKKAAPEQATEQASQQAPEQAIVWNRNWTLNVAAVVFLLVLVNFSASGWTPLFDLLTEEVGNVVERARGYDRIGGQPDRYFIWDSALVMFRDSPFFGSGMGGFLQKLLAEPERYRVYITLRVHNDLLELGVELGVLGVILFAGASIGLLSALYKLITRGEMRQRLFFLTIAIALAGSAANMQVSFPYQMPVPLVIFAMYAALIVKAGDAHNPKLKTIQLALSPARLAAAGALPGLVFVFVFAVNSIWLSTMSRVSANARQVTWENPITNNPFVCHKSLIQVLYFFSEAYSAQGLHLAAIDALGSMARCVPGTWVYDYKVGRNLFEAKRYEEAVEMLTRAMAHEPRGIFTHRIVMFDAHIALNDHENAARVFWELSAQPEEALASRPLTLRHLTRMALILGLSEQAVKHFRLHRKYYGIQPIFEGKIGKYIRAE